ncbi:MAG TPA: hypothetical protein VMU13_03765 [Candidatus Paceibacterota bacterium]|nr:hypothetical protein [Candidatus Paceibacterota bacterium]
MEHEVTTISGNVLLAAGSGADVPAVLELLQAAGIELHANPDLYVRDYRQFGIDDALELRSRASSRAIGSRRVFVISASSITNEAQNALLKTLEEPPGRALFVFVHPAPETLLSTMRSRAQTIALERSTTNRFDAKGFFAAPLTRRIDIVKAIVEKDGDDKYNTGAILSFLAALEIQVAQMKDSAKKKATLEALYRARGYVTDRGALVKTLLESVALLAPVL